MKLPGEGLSADADHLTSGIRNAIIIADRRALVAAFTIRISADALLCVRDFLWRIYGNQSDFV